MNKLLFILIIMFYSNVSYTQDTLSIVKMEQDILSKISDTIQFNVIRYKEIFVSSNTVIKTILPSCIGYTFLEKDPSDSLFFKIINDTIKYKKTNNTYGMRYKKKQIITSIEVSIFQFRNDRNWKKLSDLLLKCYSLPGEYPIAFYAREKILVIFKPYLIEINEKGRWDLYETLLNHLKTKLSGEYEYLPISLDLK